MKAGLARGMSMRRIVNRFASFPWILRGMTFLLALAAVAVPASASPTPAPSQPRPQTYIEGMFVPVGIVNSDLGHGFSVLPSGAARISATFSIAHQMFLLDGDFYQIASNNLQGTAHLDNDEARFGIGIPRWPLYVDVSTLYRSPPAPSSVNPDLVGAGIGVEVPPDLRKRWSPYGRLLYYPKIEAEDGYVDPITNTPQYLRYAEISYEIGLSRRIGASNTAVTGSIHGIHIQRLTKFTPNAPGDTSAILLNFGYALRF